MNIKTTVVAAVSALAFGAVTIAPASADQAAVTRNEIIGGIAAVAGLVIENNVAHKRASANQVAGNLPDGATVYNDGHVVNPDGTSYYPSQYGQQVACNNGYCSTSNTNGQYTYNNGGSNPNGGGYANIGRGWTPAGDRSWSRR